MRPNSSILSLIDRDLVMYLKSHCSGLPKQSSGKDSMLSLQEVRVQSLVGKQTSYMPHSAAKKKKSHCSIFIIYLFFHLFLLVGG